MSYPYELQNKSRWKKKQYQLQEPHGFNLKWNKWPQL